jgi:hypothetical protein
VAEGGSIDGGAPNGDSDGAEASCDGAGAIGGRAGGSMGGSDGATRNGQGSSSSVIKVPFANPSGMVGIKLTFQPERSWRNDEALKNMFCIELVCQF